MTLCFLFYNLHEPQTHNKKLDHQEKRLKISLIDIYSDQWYKISRVYL